MDKERFDDDFGFNSSPVADHPAPELDFSIGLDVPFRTNDYQTEFDFSNIGFTTEYEMQSKGFMENIETPMPQQPSQTENIQQYNTRPMTPKVKKQPMVFRPFASFEAAEITVQTLKNGLNNRSVASMSRAHSMGVMPFPL